MGRSGKGISRRVQTTLIKGGATQSPDPPPQRFFCCFPPLNLFRLLSPLLPLLLLPKQFPAAGGGRVEEERRAKIHNETRSQKEGFLQGKEVGKEDGGRASEARREKGVCQKVYYLPRLFPFFPWKLERREQGCYCKM